MEGKRSTTAEMQVVEILIETGWDFDTYRQQPQWVIDHILSRRVAQRRYAKFKQTYGGK